MDGEFLFVYFENIDLHIAQILPAAKTTTARAKLEQRKRRARNLSPLTASPLRVTLMGCSRAGCVPKSMNLHMASRYV